MQVNIQRYFHPDDEKFGGTGVNVKKVVKAEKIECEKKEYSIELNHSAYVSYGI